ncbi:hypothetical protein LCGC14_1444010 [marine sediment metagenome]|uniref:Glycosyltransferase 2-like domain-containing protein n=1 Tax=marine sediment metagenome TaxID=412755 RepID=A0A0F9JJS4_9ZZZZ
MGEEGVLTMKWPKVLIGGPTSVHKDYCVQELVKAVKQLKRYPNCEILFVDNTYDDGQFAHKMRRLGIPTIHIKPANENVPTRKRLVDCRNWLREKALRDGFDYLLSFESDLVPLYPENVDIVQRLIMSGKKVISGVYCSLKCSKGLFVCKPCNRPQQEEFIKDKDNPVCYRCGGKLEKHEHKWAELPMAWTWAYPKQKDSDFIKMLDLDAMYQETIKQQSAVIHVQSTGVGCILIHRSVLKDIRFRYIQGRLSCDDMFFAIDCRAHNPPIDIYLDTGVVLEHRYREWKGKYKENR